MHNQIIGKYGEDIAGSFLKNKGYNIFEKNFREKTGEIDIIAFDRKLNEIVFAEVKTRTSKQFGHPEEAVTKNKIIKIVKTADIWLHKNKRDKRKWRIDVISIEIEKGETVINHIKNISL